MSAILELDIGITGQTLTCNLYPDGSDTPAATGIALTEATNRKGYYTADITLLLLTGLHWGRVLTGTSNLARFWAELVASGRIIGMDSRLEVLNLDVPVSSVSTDVDAIGTMLSSLIAAVLGDFGEPAQGAPPVSASRLEKVDWLYKFLRNKADQSATEQQIYADDGVTVDHKRPITSASGVVTVGAVVSGP